MNIYTVTGMSIAQYPETLPVVSSIPLYTITKKFRLQILANNEVHAYYKVIEGYNAYNTHNCFYMIYDVKVKRGIW